MADSTALLSKDSRVRKHFFDAERMILFSDVIFAVIMTTMVIPLKLNEEDIVHGFDLKSFFIGQWSEYLVYMFCFVTTANLWMTHIRLFSFLKYVDDIIIWLNLFALLCATFLPYALSLISVFMRTMPDGFHLAIVLGAVPVFLLGLIKTTIMWYSIRHKELLVPEECTLPMGTVKVALYISFLSSSVLAVIAILVGFDERLLNLSRTCLFATTGVATMTRFIFYLYLRCKGDQQYTLLSEPPSRARIEALTDGVFSIAATLMLLDFSSQVLPSTDSLKEDYNNSLTAALEDGRYIFFSYIVSFVIIGMLWLVQYSMFQLIKMITAPLALVNLLILSFVGVIPFTSGVIVLFSEASNSDNEVLAVRVAMVVVFLAGVGQLLFWIIALFQKMVVTVDNPHVMTHQFFKTLILPSVSFVVYWVSLAQEYAVIYLVYGFVLITTPCLFILLDLYIYACLRKCKKNKAIGRDMHNLQYDSVS